MESVSHDLRVIRARFSAYFLLLSFFSEGIFSFLIYLWYNPLLAFTFLLNLNEVLPEVSSLKKSVISNFMSCLALEFIFVFHFQNCTLFIVFFRYFKIKLILNGYYLSDSFNVCYFDISAKIWDKTNNLPRPLTISCEARWPLKHTNASRLPTSSVSSPHNQTLPPETPCIILHEVFQQLKISKYLDTDGRNDGSDDVDGDK